MRPAFRICAAFAVIIGSSVVLQADWPRFRGISGAGVSTESVPVPTKWSPSENLKWKTPLPGPGVSSPIVIEDKVFVTSYSGYGVDRNNVGEIEKLQRHILCLDRGTGEVLWKKSVKAKLPEDPYSGMGIPSHGYASHTPVTDGEHVFAFFGKSGVYAYDMEGNEIWNTSVGSGSDNRRWGSSSSPIVHDNMVIVTASAESRSLVGLDKKTGEELWRQETDGLSDIWGTPLIMKVGQDRSDLVLGVPYEIWGLNPANGKLRWYAEATGSNQYSSSVAVMNGVVYGIEGRGGGSVAVKGGGKGDVTEKNTIWTGNDSARFATPLVVGERLFYFANGVANCISAKDGSNIFKGRLPSTNTRGSEPGAQPQGGGRGGRGGGRGFGGGGGFGNQDYSSPVSAGGKVYYVKSSGETYVIKAGDKFDLLSTNKFTEESENFSGTPAISKGEIFVRSSKHIYCVANMTTTTAEK